MKTLYIDCGMGAAGDMLTAALLELIENKDEFVDELNHLGIPDVKFEAVKAVKCGITGTQMKVLVHGTEEGCGEEHAHHHDQEVHEEEHGHHHDHEGHEEEHGHHHDHEGHEQEQAHHHEEIHEHAHEHSRENEHEHSHDHEHGHEHEHNHDHEHEHTHEHTHDHEHHHHHSSMHDIEHIVENLAVSDKVKKDVMNIYRLIAEAESHAHGRPVTEIHFHEVGTMDAIADVTAICLLMEKLSPDRIISSPVHVGSGQVKCAHGILPVPAPATAFILRGVPIYGGEVNGELCTPTGAAVLKYYVNQFGSMPVMNVSAIGYGMGKKDFKWANCVRVLYGESSAEGKGKSDKECSPDELLSEFECNLDDITGEALGFAIKKLYEAGAKEVFTVPVQMKKSRPGILLTVLCESDDREEIIRTIFEHTTTIGIRETKVNRYVLTRREEVVQTAFGPVRKKISEGYGVKREKFEYEDLACAAEEQNVSIEEILRRISHN